MFRLPLIRKGAYTVFGKVATRVQLQVLRESWTSSLVSRNRRQSSDCWGRIMETWKCFLSKKLIGTQDLSGVHLTSCHTVDLWSGANLRRLAGRHVETWIYLRYELLGWRSLLHVASHNWPIADWADQKRPAKESERTKPTCKILSIWEDARDWPNPQICCTSQNRNLDWEMISLSAACTLDELSNKAGELDTDVALK